MKKSQCSTWLFTAATLLVSPILFAQASAPAQPGQSVPATAAPAKTTPRRQKAAVQRIPMETAPPTAPTAAGTERTAEQRAADEKLLEQQQAQSDKAAKVTDAVVNKAQQQQDKVQSEQRIQSAPGPSQTGVVPAAGVPVAPATTGQNIQTTTSPTLPPAQSVNPSQVPQPPASSPPTS